MWYGIVYSIAYPLITLFTILPLPFNATLWTIDVTWWLFRLFFWQSFYVFEFFLWYADFTYMMSLRMILEYDKTSAFFYHTWDDSLYVLIFSPFYLMGEIGSWIWDDYYSSRPNVVEALEYTHLCNIDYWEADSEYYLLNSPWGPCFSEDLLNYA